MALTKEEKDFLIEEITKHTGPKPLFYLKFCSCEKFANDVCEGNLYSNTAEFFRQKEIESGERGQGDQYELLLSLKTESITAVDNETGNIVFTAPKGSFKVQFDVDKIIPIVSFTGIPLFEMLMVDANETHADFLFPFTDEEYSEMSNKFGKYCVIISARELEAKIQNYCNYFGYDYIFDKVEYCSQNRIDRIQAFNQSTKERFLYKNNDLAYQREFRLAIGVEIPEDHFITIGKLETAKIIESNKLKDLLISINYISKPRE
mgnify:FL=1